MVGRYPCPLLYLLPTRPYTRPPERKPHKPSTIFGNGQEKDGGEDEESDARDGERRWRERERERERESGHSGLGYMQTVERECS